MHKFTDSEGRPWEIRLNGWALKKLKERLDFDARDPESILKAANDPGLLCDVLYLLCETQCQAKQVSDQQFGEAMADGDTIDKAAEAYIQETVDFFPQRQRPALKALLAKINEAQDLAAKLATEKIESQEFEMAINEMLTAAGSDIDKMMSETRRKFLAGTTIGSSSGNVPASRA